MYFTLTAQVHEVLAGESFANSPAITFTQHELKRYVDPALMALFHCIIGGRLDYSGSKSPVMTF